VAKTKTNMKMQPNPIVALASGTILLFGVLCQTAHAQTVIDNETVQLAANNGVAADDLTVQSEVTANLSGDYTYTYIVTDPGAPNTAGWSTFQVEFNATPPGAVENGSVSPGGDPSGNSGVNWNPISEYEPTSVETLSFNSTYAPTLNTANATGGDVPSSWESIPAGADVYVPNSPVVPEPATTTLLMLIPLLLAFRPNLVKKS
jgi:hypothetical protein